MAHSLTQVDRLHEAKNTGQGIYIAIIDDGVDYMHPALGGGFKVNGAKFQYGGDMIGVAQLERRPDGSDNTVYDDDPLDDCGQYKGSSTGHGTHVAGIIGAKAQNYSGVAPDAILGMWRVFDCYGNTNEDAIVEAMLAADQTKPQIISMSVGHPSGWSEYADAAVASRIAARGTIVVAAAGNAGYYGALTIESPSAGNGVISVASFDNQYTLKRVVRIATTGEEFEYTVASESIGGVPEGLVSGGGSSGACNQNTIPIHVKGNIALVAQDGSCTDDIKAANLARHGAVGVVIYNNGDKKSADLPYTPYAPEAVIPVAGVSYNAGEAIIAAVRQVLPQNKLPRLLNTGRVTPVSTSGLVSEFSAVGPSYENDLKPTIGGVGGFMYSTYPQYRGSWTMMNGTSMAAPYVSGAIALYLSALGQNRQSPQYILEQFQNYAFLAASDVTKSYFDSPFRQGAGLVQVYDAIYQSVHVSPASISFNDTEHLNRQHTLRISNRGQDIVQYKVVYRNSVSLLPYNFQANDIQFNEPAMSATNVNTAQLQFSQDTIIVHPKAHVDLTVTVLVPDINEKLHVMYGGYVFLQNTVENQASITVPYIGIASKQRELPMFTRDIHPILRDSSGQETEYNTDNPLTYNRNIPQTQPTILVSLFTPSRLVEFPLYNVQGQEIGLAFAHSVNSNGRATTAKPFSSALLWDGTFRVRNAGFISDKKNPPKQMVQIGSSYVIGVRALKIFGNPSNPNDWQEWKVGPITVV
ncbi:peptidase S8/S53 domain-containing protein [Fennellomyces sp. T-0311]|nr:peptidase S8/S53 domain-containing protein [Fennellomyces sp. T-0311]